MALVQSGWLDVTQTVDTGLTGGNGELWSLISDSVNNHVGRDGTVRGCKIKLVNKANIVALGITILRHTAGTSYKVIGKYPSEPLSAGNLSEGVNTLDFGSDVIEHVRSTDLIGVICRSDTATIMNAMDAADTLPVDDSATAKFRYYDSNSISYSDIAVGSTYDHAGGGAAFAVMPVAALMNPPKVIVVGDSISEGSPHNITYRRDDGSTNPKDIDGSFAQIAYRHVGWECELAGNTQSSNNLAETYVNDMNTVMWAKALTDYLHVHCGINDIADSRTWTQTLASLNDILTACRSHGVQLILTSIFPCDNLDAAKSRIRDTFNSNIRNWSALHTDVLYFDLNQALGQFRSGGDAGNRWDLWNGFNEDDTHLSKSGAAMAAGLLASFIRSFELAKEKNYQINARRNLRARYQPLQTERSWNF